MAPIDWFEHPMPRMARLILNSTLHEKALRPIMSVLKTIPRPSLIYLACYRSLRRWDVSTRDGPGSSTTVCILSCSTVVTSILLVSCSDLESCPLELLYLLCIVRCPKPAFCVFIHACSEQAAKTITVPIPNIFDADLKSINFYKNRDV